MTTPLALLNVSGGRLDISRLVLRRGGQTFPVTRWQTEWLGAPLNAFPDRHCLHVGLWLRRPWPPEDCISRSSVIHISSAERLWLEGEFTVEQGGTTLATCQAARAWRGEPAVTGMGRFNIAFG